MKPASTRHMLTPSSSAQYSPMNEPDRMQLLRRAKPCGKKAQKTPEPVLEALVVIPQIAGYRNTATT
jgi:hypothetical protein